jgi:hypothetical protein
MCAAGEPWRSTNEESPQKPQRPRGGVTLQQKTRKSAGCAPQNSPKHLKIALKTEKQAIFTAKTPIF